MASDNGKHGEIITKNLHNKKNENTNVSFLMVGDIGLEPMTPCL